MNASLKIPISILFCTAICALSQARPPLRVSLPAGSGGAQTDAPKPAADHDGQRDFDFEFGAWSIHLLRLQHPLTGSQTWDTLEGTALVSKVWGGRANLVELRVNGPATHIEGLSLRLYHPQSRQWSMHWANSKNGALDAPVAGEFRNGIGEFYGRDEFAGRSIYVRFVFSEITADSFRGIQSFSADGGKTWEPNWIETFTRPTGGDAANQQTPSGVESGRSHDFDFEIGNWKTHLSRLLHPLSGSSTWVNLEGTSIVREIWNGRANLVELEVDDPGGNHVEGLSLRLYDPRARQWSLNFANSGDGVLSVPTIGEFRNGRGEFYDQESFKGRTILVRNVWSDITPNSCHFEQSFSEDGGKTWEVNWIAGDTRANATPSKTP